MRAAELEHRRSLPERPTSSSVEQPDSTSMPPISSMSISVENMEDRHVYNDIRESPEESEVEPRPTCFSGWREAIDNASKDELRTIVSNVIGSVESGLPPVECQSEYDRPSNGSLQ